MAVWHDIEELTVEFWGADTEQLRGFGHDVTTDVKRIDELFVDLTAVINSVDWAGADADAFRDDFQTILNSQVSPVTHMLLSLADNCDAHADEQDDASDNDSSWKKAGSPWSPPFPFPNNPIPLPPFPPPPFPPPFPLESDGFWGDLLGGPEAGYWGNLLWNALSAGLDLVGFIPEPTGVSAIASLINDIPAMGIAFYDALQSFQDGDWFGAADATITFLINGVDAAVNAIGLIPHPVTKAIGEIGGMITGGVDLAWSSLTMAAQASAIAGGPGEGSTTRFLMEFPAYLTEELTGVPLYTQLANPVANQINETYSQATETIRDFVPIIDPMIDSMQLPLEYFSQLPAVSWIEPHATMVNEAIREFFDF